MTSCTPAVARSLASSSSMRHGGDVDEGDRLGVEDDGACAWFGGVLLDRCPHGLGVGEEQAGLDTQDGDAGNFDVGRGGARRSAYWPACAGDLAELGDVWFRRSVEQEQQRHDDADDQSRQRVEQQHAEHRRDGGDEVGSGRRAVDLAEANRVEPVEAAERGEVDELDDRRDDDRGERRFRQVLEQSGQEQQRHDREDGHDQAGHLRLRARPIR